MFGNYIKLFSQIIFLVFIVTIEYLATTSLSIKVVENSWDKANHFIAFFALFLTFSFGFEKISLHNKIVLLLLFGIQIEIVQAFLPFREFSLFDIFADFIGILIGIFVVNRLRLLGK